MMENDGVTRLYITSGAKGAWQMLPLNEAVPHDQALYGEAALEVLARSDFDCVSSLTYEEGNEGHFGKLIASKWVCYGKDGERFVVDRMGWTRDEDYTNLAEILEERASMKGLTIFVS